MSHKLSQPRRRSSRHISLVLIGSVAVTALAACSREENRGDVRRDVYASKESCLADWGNSPKDCEPVRDRSGTHGGGTHYYGGSYPSTGNAFAPRSARAVGTSTVSRGGFGSSGHSAASSGG